MGNGKLSKSTRDPYLLTCGIDNFGFSILVSNILLLTTDFSCGLHKNTFYKNNLFVNPKGNAHRLRILRHKSTARRGGSLSPVDYHAESDSGH